MNIKHTLFTVLIALGIGFAAGWAISSANRDLESFSPEKVIASVPPPRENTPPAVPDRDLPDDPGNPPRDRPSQNPAGRIPETSDSEIRAKWMRLSEVLDLTPEQSKAVEAVIAETRPDTAGETSLKEAIRAAGEQLQADLLATLTPEQQQEFKELQRRSRENMVETKAQTQLGEEFGHLDLTAAQREQALGLIRSSIEEKTASIPDSARLFLAGSVLPLEEKPRIDEDGLLLLDLLSETTPAGQPASFESVAEQRKAEIESRMSRFEGILTPAQLASYRLGLEESLANLEKINAPPDRD